MCTFKSVEHYSLCLSIVILTMSSVDAFSASIGPLSPGAVTNFGNGNPPWINPELVAISDDLYATSENVDGGSGGTDLLDASNFGFQVPNGSIITGIEIFVERHSGSGESAFDAATVTKPDETMSSPAFPSGDWSTTDNVATVNDGLWGLSWTVDDINSPNFSVQYGAFFVDGVYFVDSISVTVHFTPPPIEDPCSAFPLVDNSLTQFVDEFAIDTNDLDGDGLPENASLALLQAVACNPSAPVSMSTALFNAYNINHWIFDGESNAEALSEYRNLIALLMSVSDGHELAIKDILQQANLPLTGDYVAVTCIESDCMPASIPTRSLMDEFEVFADGVRGTNEPFSATGDLDDDGTDNITEWDNVLVQGGSTSNFVTAATSSGRDGTEAFGAGGGGGCFIATAAYGTPLANDIDTLRIFRDHYLLTNVFGTIFSDSYYRLSPPLARAMAKHPMMAKATRIVIAPIVTLLEFGLLHPWLVMSIVTGLAALAFRAQPHMKRAN